MNYPILLSIATPSVPTLINRSSLRRGFFFLTLSIALTCFAPSPSAHAQACPTLCDSKFNTALGDDALFSGGSGGFNTAIGFQALHDDTTGSDNTATGTYALNRNTTGKFNTATGVQTLIVNTTGSDNTATGFDALFFNTGNSNTATGADSLENNTTGNFNTANGSSALSHNSTGSDNTATGSSALQNNTIGFSDTANGVDALFSNTSGVQNTAIGVEALFNNTTGGSNTANGFDALLHNTTGINNTANGVNTLEINTIGHDNVADGFQALLNNKGSNNIGLGSNAGANVTTGSNNINIGAPGAPGDANTIRIGKQGTQAKTFVAGIRGVTVASGVGVIVGTTGQLGTVASSARFKEAIKPMDKASEAILNVKPVTFRYKHELDPDGIPQFGLVAEQVEKVNPDLVVRDEDGKVMTVRYEAVNAMLLNEFQKEHRIVERQVRKLEEQEVTIQQLKVLIAEQHKLAAQQQNQIDRLTTDLCNVSNERFNSSPRVVAENH